MYFRDDRHRDRLGCACTDIETHRAEQATLESLRGGAQLGEEAVPSRCRTEQADVAQRGGGELSQIGAIGDEVMAHDHRRVEVAQVEQAGKLVGGTEHDPLGLWKVLAYRIRRPVIEERDRPAERMTRA